MSCTFRQENGGCCSCNRIMKINFCSQKCECSSCILDSSIAFIDREDKKEKD